MNRKGLEHFVSVQTIPWTGLELEGKCNHQYSAWGASNCPVRIYYFTSNWTMFPGLSQESPHIHILNFSINFESTGGNVHIGNLYKTGSLTEKWLCEPMPSIVKGVSIMDA